MLPYCITNNSRQFRHIMVLITSFVYIPELPCSGFAVDYTAARDVIGVVVVERTITSQGELLASNTSWRHNSPLSSLELKSADEVAWSGRTVYTRVLLRPTDRS